MKNFMIFIFSYKARLIMAYIFIALNVVLVLVGCIIAIVSLYMNLIVTKYLFAEKAEIQFVYSVFALFGTQVIIQYLIGIRIVELCFVKAHKRSTKRNLYFWLILCANTIVDLLILAFLIIRISKHIIRSIRHSMEKGMRHYLTDPLWKHTVDRWQYSLRCCGINNIEDWYGSSWLHKYNLKIDNPRVQSFLLSKDRVHLPITPWSCCDIDFPMQCFHDPIQQIHSAYLWKEQMEVPPMSLYRTGCLDIIRYPIEVSLVTFLFLIIILLVVHIVIIIISRFMYTSCRNAVILHDCLGRAPGWLFTRDCLAERRGRTVFEIMDELDHSNDDETSVDIEADETDQETEEDALLKRKASPVHAARPPPQLMERQVAKKVYQPQVPPRRESINRRGDSQRSMNVSSLKTDPCPANCPNAPQIRPCKYPGQPCDTAACPKYNTASRDSARDPVCTVAEKGLMMG